MTNPVSTEAIRQVFSSKASKAQADLDSAQVHARQARDFAIGRAHAEYSRLIDASLLAYDEAIKAAINERVEGMKQVLMAERVRPS